MDGKTKNNCALKRMGARTVGLHPWHVAQLSVDELPSQLDDLSRNKTTHSRHWRNRTGSQSQAATDVVGANRSTSPMLLNPPLDGVAAPLPLVLHVVRAQGRALEIIQTLGPVPEVAWFIRLVVLPNRRALARFGFHFHSPQESVKAKRGGFRSSQNGAP